MSRTIPRNALTAAALAIASCVGQAFAAADDAALTARVEHVLATTPLIDGHNDLPWELRERFGALDKVDLAVDQSTLPKPKDAAEDWVALMTDMPRLRAGHVGGQFWSVWIPTSLAGPAAVQTTLEQIDLVHNLVARYPRDLQMAYTADDVVRAHKAGRVASLIGIEGGHQIGDSLPALRQMY